MLTQALGLIETIGLTSAIEAADTAIKSSNVKLIGYEYTRGDGMVTIKIEGDVGAVKAAVQAAKSSAEKVGGVYSTLVIPRHAKGIDALVYSSDTVGIVLPDITEKAEATSTEKAEEPSVSLEMPDMIETLSEEKPSTITEVPSTIEEVPSTAEEPPSTIEEPDIAENSSDTVEEPKVRKNKTPRKKQTLDKTENPDEKLEC
jgi:microcompartment protein CcmL/EutN